MLGVFTNISEPGILAVNFEITINNSNNACNIKNKILEIGSRIKNINIDANPKIIIIPRSGLANILDIKNVKETVLKFSIVMGIIMSCAEKVMLKASAILFFIFNFKRDAYTCKKVFFSIAYLRSYYYYCHYARSYN